MNSGDMYKYSDDGELIMQDDEALVLTRVVVNEGFSHCDRVFVTAHPDILNCNKGDEQHTKFYFS